MSQGDVFIFQALQITHHLGFAVIAIEIGMLQIIAAPLQIIRNNRGLFSATDSAIYVSNRKIVGGIANNTSPDGFDIFGRCAFVETDANLIVADKSIHAKIDASGVSAFDNNACLLLAKRQGQGIEIIFVGDFNARLLKSSSENRRQSMYSQGNILKSCRTVVHRVQGRNIGQQNLRGADVAIGFFATNMLFTSLQCHAKRLTSAGVDRDTDDATGNCSLVFIFGGKVSGVRPAIAHRHAKPLRAAGNHIGTHFSRRLEQSEAHQISRNNSDHLVFVQPGNARSQILSLAQHRWILKNCAKQFIKGHVIDITDE